MPDDATPTPVGQPLVASPPPENWKDLDEDQKLVWLNGQPFNDAHPTISLGHCYRYGVYYSHLALHVYFMLSKALEKLDDGDASTPVNKAGRAALASAMRVIGQLNYDITHNCRTIMATGKLPESTVIPLKLLSIPDFNSLATVRMADFSKIFEDGTKTDDIWEMLSDVVAVFNAENKHLNAIKPGPGVSYAQMIQTFTKAGKEFYKEWTRDPDAPPPVPEKSTKAPANSDVVKRKSGDSETTSSKIIKQEVKESDIPLSKM